MVTSSHTRVVILAILWTDSGKLTNLKSFHHTYFDLGQIRWSINFGKLFSENMLHCCSVIFMCALYICTYLLTYMQGYYF